ncbi:MAG: hypothetical protein ACRBN8_32895 [Nannocystales bacterium]
MQVEMSSRITPLVLVVALASCSASSGGTSEPAPAVSRMDLGGCDRSAVIEDSEDNDHRLLEHGGRGGYVYTFLDEAGSTVEPVAGRLGGTFSQAVGGANGSLHAARFQGKTAAGTIVFAGYGLNFVDPKAPYDASAYEGITFFARRSANSGASLRVKIPDVSTDAEGGQCTECFNDFGKAVELEEHWQQFVVPFDSMKQMPGWGAPRPGSIDSAAIYGVQFQFNAAQTEFDIWIDDVSFYGCDAK